MKRFLSLALAMCIGPLAFAQVMDPNPIRTPVPINSNGATATSTNTVGASINQNFEAGDPTTGRLFVNPVQPYQAPVATYLGPWATGSNILDDLRTLPETITVEQARLMYNGGVSARINKMSDGSYQFRAIKILRQLPLRPVLNNGKPVLSQDGHSYLMEPDESRYERMGYIFLQGDAKATTVDVIAKAVLVGLDNGANQLFLIKKVSNTQTSSTGWGIGIGYVSGGLNGNQMNQAQAASGGTGFNHATAKPQYTEGLIALALRETDAPTAVIPPLPPIEAPKPIVVPAPAPVVVPAPAPALAITKLVLDERMVHFANGKATLTQEGQVVIDKLTKELKGTYILMVDGYTSSVGSPALNERLSRERAVVVTEALVKAGVPRSSIQTNGKTSKDHAANRRVDIAVITTTVQ
jgi:outer membrane protein OmpA-like peptidoglycan-associated protein